VSESRLLSLALEQWSTRPVGNITDDSGRTINFDGWLSLATALEHMCGGAEHEPTPDLSQGGGPAVSLGVLGGDPGEDLEHRAGGRDDPRSA
jgi:hypothetical protein